MAYQVIVLDNDARSWDSIRDTEREALFKVCEYMRNDHDINTQYVGRQIAMALIHGKATGEITVQGYTINFKYIP